MDASMIDEVDDDFAVDPADWRDAHEMLLVEIMGLDGYLAAPLEFRFQI